MSTTAVDRSGEVRRLERIEGWKRRLPILPALLFTIFVTQIPFLFTLFYSLTDWRIDTPEPRQFIGFDSTRKTTPLTATMVATVPNSSASGIASM